MKKNIFLGLFLALFLIGFEAKAEDKYMVEVNVDVTDQDSVAAREKAMKDANRKAFLEIVAKNTDGAYYNKFANFSNEQILNFIKEVGVSEEKSSPYRYAAKLNILVDGNLLLEYMKENNIPATYKNSSYTIVIPIYYEKENSEGKLWEEDNYWRYVWENRGIIRNGNVNYLSLPTNEENLQLGLDDVFNMDRKTFNRLTEANPSNKVYVAKLMPDIYNYLNIDIINAKTGETSNVTIYGAPNEKNFNIAVDMLIARLSSNAETMNPKPINNDYEEKKESTPAKENQMEVIYMFDNPAELVEVRKIIDRLPEVKKTTLLTVGNGKARLLLDVLSSAEQVAYAVSREGYAVAKDEGVYVLRRGGYERNTK